MDAQEFSERLWDFAVRVAKLVDALPDTRVRRHIAGQPVRCGTSSAPNYDEACSAESKADFSHKIGVATKEMRETRGWLRFIVKLEMQPASRMAPLIAGSEELLKMLARSFATAKGRPRAPINRSSRAAPQSPVPSRQFPVINSARP